ncbi:carboxymuconolactone decarboxylase family protein [Nocardia stercoris]|uniref:Alkylhydroperoxidase AhpD family core domain-containing protein n=1 Tax=Nocardia stercoris TaxID=2483361 RepID=A0A3M2KRR6_9NOCA|nr:carboxymuconolactone decarboxylase family protein [Nocardia stercoris]RMI28342.1 alkylhydroperoxidase AhpD family core domain-containing protein [Nocardia stercoris]
MRPASLERGIGPVPKMLFRFVRMVTGRPVPDAAKITFYRPDFYGAAMKKFTHEAMRGDSAWSVAERELMAAYISEVNRAPFCVGAHTATAAQAFGDPDKVAAALADPASADIPVGLAATLVLLGTLARSGRVDAAHVRAVLATGVTAQQIEDALAVAFAFNVTDRLANAFDFEQLTPEGFASGAKYLLKRGYR